MRRVQSGSVSSAVNCPLLVILLLYWVILRPAVQNANKLFAAKVLISHFQYLSSMCFLRVSFSPVISWIVHGINSFSALLITELPLACMGVSSPEYTKAIIGPFCYCKHEPH